MAALAVIYRNIFKHRAKSSAKVELEYFRAGKLHLESHGQSEAQGTVLVALFDEMMRKANEAVRPS